MPLKEVKYVQNIGRFEKAQSVADATFSPCTLVFGENGWGKSTLADLLRSLTKHNPNIVVGRKTLAGGPGQKAVLRFGDQQAVFDGGAWSGIRPAIAVYDSVFVNDNVFSDDVVTNEHLKKQYGMVVGEEGVHRVRNRRAGQRKPHEQQPVARRRDGTGRHRVRCRTGRHDAQGIPGP